MTADAAPARGPAHETDPASIEAGHTPDSHRRAGAALTGLGRVAPRQVWAVLVMATTVLVIAAAFRIVYSALSAVGTVVVAGLIACLLTTVLLPLSRWLRARRLPPSIAAAIAVVVGVAALAASVALILDGLVASWASLGARLQGGLDRLEAEVGRQEFSDVTARIGDAFRANASVIAGRLGDTLGAVSHLAAGTFLTVVITFFLVRDGAHLTAGAATLLPRRHRRPVIRAARAAWTTLAGTVRGVLIVATADAVLIWLCLSLLQVPAATALALLTFLTAFVPIIGAVIAGAVIALTALVGNGPTVAALALLAVIVVNQADAHLLQPFIMSRAARLHPLAVILAVAVGAAYWGIAGAALAVPATAVITSAFRAYTTHPSSARERAVQHPA